LISLPDESEEAIITVCVRKNEHSARVFNSKLHLKQSRGSRHSSKQQTATGAQRVNVAENWQDGGEERVLKKT